MINNILTVCVGNICRSPMAEVLLKAKLPSASVSSAGIGALIGHQADPYAQELMKGIGLDLSDHRAQQINAQMCQRAEIILVMEEKHRAFILDHYPFIQGRIFRICEHDRIDVPDPYRQPKSYFEAALELISSGVKSWSDRIAKL